MLCGFSQWLKGILKQFAPSDLYGRIFMIERRNREAHIVPTYPKSQNNLLLESSEISQQ